MSRPAPSRIRRRGSALLALVVSTTAGLLAAEGLVRWLAPQAVWIQPPDLYIADPPARYRLRPGVRGTMTDRTEYAVRIVTDARGVRVPAAGARPPAAGLRILALGDSFTFGVGVEEEETWIEQLAAALGAEGISVWTCNGGVPGYGAPDEAALFERHLAAVAPDLVVLGVYLANDLLDASSASFSVEVRDGTLVVGGHEPNVLDWLNYHSHLYMLAKGALPGPLRKRIGLGPTRTQRQVETEMGAYARTLPDGAIEGRETTDRAYGELLATARARGARVVAMIFPEHISVDPEFWQARFAFLELDPAGYDPEGPRRIFRDLLAQHAIPYLDLTDAVAAEESRGRHLYHPIDSHFTAAGHALAARELERFLREQSLLPQPRERQVAAADLSGRPR